jgi:hypothetical protein
MHKNSRKYEDFFKFGAQTLPKKQEFLYSVNKHSRKHENFFIFDANTTGIQKPKFWRYGKPIHLLPAWLPAASMFVLIVNLWLSKNFVARAVIRKLLRDAARTPLQGDTICTHNFVDRPIKKCHLKIREYNNKMERYCWGINWV